MYGVCLALIEVFWAFVRPISYVCFMMAHQYLGPYCFGFLGQLFQFTKYQLFHNLKHILYIKINKRDNPKYLRSVWSITGFTI